MRGLYLSYLPMAAGRNHLAGRLLYDHFRSDFGDVLLKHAVTDDRSPDEDHLTGDDLLGGAFDFLYLERGLTCWPSGDSWKVPANHLLTYARSGGVAIVGDADSNDAGRQWAAYQAAEALFGAVPTYERRQPPPGWSQQPVVYGADEMRQVDRSHRHFHCLPEEMWISEWLRAAFEGIEAIAVSGPVALTLVGADIAASGNRDSSATLAGDVFQDRPIAFPFATVRQHGHGYVVLVAAAMSHDVFVEATPDNARWLSNLIVLLTDEVARNRARRTGSATAPVPDLDEPMPEAALLDYMAEFSRAFTGIERDLRRALVARLSAEEQRHGKPGWARERLSAVARSDDKQRQERIYAMTDLSAIADSLLWTEERTVVTKNWPVFERTFGNDKKAFEEHTARLNHRPQAHSKTLTLRQRLHLDESLRWLRARLDETR